MTYAEALKSSDPDTIKSSRGDVKGQITKIYNELKAVLDVSEDFDHETIDNEKVKLNYEKLKNDFSVFQ